MAVTRLNGGMDLKAAAIPLTAGVTTPIWALLVPIAAAVVAAGAAWAVALQSRKSERLLVERRSREEQVSQMSARVSRYLAATYASALGISHMARHKDPRRTEIRQGEVWPARDLANEALMAIEINDSRELVARARTLDDGLRQLLVAAESRTYSPDEWRGVRTPLLNPAVDALKDAARAQAGREPYGSVAQGKGSR